MNQILLEERKLYFMKTFAVSVSLLEINGLQVLDAKIY